MIHDVWCEQPSPQPNREGILRCPSCKFVAPVRRSAVQLSNYRCPVHLDTQVTHRGRGCSACAAQTLKSAAARRSKRKKALQPSNPTERPER